eukprot:jgi/Tetstr1/422427/TSEL_013265.t1
MWVFCAPSLALFLALLVAQQAASRTSHAGDATASLARGCGGVGDVHVAVFWAALGERGTRAGVQALAETPGVTVLEVHSKRWPRDPAEFAACHRNFYANNHAEKGFTVPPRYIEPGFIAQAKGTGPFTVVLAAVDCGSVSHVSVAPCTNKLQAADTAGCDNAPKSVMLLTLKRMLRKRLSKANKYAVHATVNGNEAVHDVTSLFGVSYYAKLVAAKRAGRRWDGEVTQHHSVECVQPLVGS